MDPKLLMNFRERLDQEAAELRAAEVDTAGDRAPVELDQQSVGRLSRMDAMQQQAMAQAQERRRKAEGARITAALERLDPEVLNGTNELRLHVFGNQDRGQVVLAGLLDNLGKGAAGAAVQNLNLMLGLHEAAGLEGGT